MASTKRSYDSAQRRYLNFCTRGKFAPLPITQKTLHRYVVFLAQEGLAHTSIKSYLSALRQLQIAQGMQDPFKTAMPMLEQVVKGIKVRQGKEGRKPHKKLPITPVILRQVRAHWEAKREDPEIITLCAACVVCFFGFMRSGEIAIPSQTSYDPTYHLSWEDFAVNSREHPTFMQLTLKGSKNRPVQTRSDNYSWSDWGQTLPSVCNAGVRSGKGKQFRTRSERFWPTWDILHTVMLGIASEWEQQRLRQPSELKTP